MEIKIKTEADYQEFLDLDYLPNVVRGCSSLYGHASIQEFLKVPSKVEFNIYILIIIPIYGRQYIQTNHIN